MSLLDKIKGQLASSWAVIQTIATPITPIITAKHVDLHGKRALVTGANSGIGLEVARSLASQGAETWLLCRNQQKADEAQRDIKSSTGNDGVYVEIVDFASLGSVKSFLERWGQRPSKHDRAVDILVNNAGATLHKKQTTDEGFEIFYVTNFLASFLLTTSILSRGDFTPNARIVQVSSFGTYAAGPMDPSNLNSGDLLSKLKDGDTLPPRTLLGLYSRSKALQTLFTTELQRRLATSSQYTNVIVQACHPGNVGSPIWTREDGGGTLGLVAKVAYAWGMSIVKGAQTPIFVATSDEVVQHPGTFWYNGRRKWLPAWMLDRQLAQQFWDRWQEDAGVDVQSF